LHSKVLQITVTSPIGSGSERGLNTTHAKQRQVQSSRKHPRAFAIGALVLVLWATIAIIPACFPNRLFRWRSVMNDENSTKHVLQGRELIDYLMDRSSSPRIARRSFACQAWPMCGPVRTTRNRIARVL